jgi:nucleoside-diphosphate-sugar epimerase
MAIILVTGSSGFIGRRLAMALVARGDTVHGLDVRTSPHAGFAQHVDDLDSVERVRAILRDQNIGMVVHAGGVSGPLLARDDPYRITRANVFASLNLLEAVRIERVHRLVNLSSAAAFGPTAGAAVPDDAPLRPADIYGASKAAVDLMYGAHFSCADMLAITLRLPTVYGPGSPKSGLIATMIDMALSDSPVELAVGPDYACPFLYIDDAVGAICCALQAPEVRQPCYNVAGPDYVRMDAVARLVSDHVPGARISFGNGPPLPGYERGQFACEAARRDLSYRPAIDIAEGVARSVAFLRSARRLAAGASQTSAGRPISN